MTTPAGTPPTPRWLPCRRDGHQNAPTTATPLRFAFCGRVSTEDNQDPEASRAWQLTRATTLIEPLGGLITAEYFDIGQSRALPWKRRPQSAALLTALSDPDRGFDAVVVGEPQRAFYGNQFGNTFPLFTHYGVPLWVPEVGGPIDPDNEAHDMIMSVFGGVSKGERNRVRIRVRSAMAAQTRLEGRYLGGRPPYGYTITDLGPHPNPAKAADGKRLHGLATDPTAEATVQRIYREFLTGKGFFAIAEGLTADRIACPSAHDPDRNPHRAGIAWSKGAVRVILTNPRYTGRQVWNKQRKDEILLDIEDVTLGYTTTLRWNDQDKWIVSDRIVHPPIIDDETFAQAQDIIRSRSRSHAAPGVQRTTNLYLLRGTFTCATCDRKMQGQWIHGEAYHRCRFPAEYALANRIQHPRNVYLREKDVLGPLDHWLTRMFAPHRLDDTIDLLAAAQNLSPTSAAQTLRAESARTIITTCDAKLTTHRAALEAGADPALVTQWITETQATRARAEAELRTAQQARADQLTRDDIAALARANSDLVNVLAAAEPTDRAGLYQQLGLILTYDSGKQKVLVEMNLNQHFPGTRRPTVGVRGGT
ncbi:recombinase family protein [Kitasatospora sp. LaBMicrA B282]|uniref:recombinase family protein n=1 Tax=Kitasatospora sp. LaBMicrA B282 TaxID=3420949 RepID=UPI003D0DA125